MGYRLFALLGACNADLVEILVFRNVNILEQFVDHLQVTRNDQALNVRVESNTDFFQRFRNQIPIVEPAGRVVLVLVLIDVNALVIEAVVLCQSADQFSEFLSVFKLLRQLLI